LLFHLLPFSDYERIDTRMLRKVAKRCGIIFTGN
jgi:hypothetical protein